MADIKALVINAYIEGNTAEAIKQNKAAADLALCDALEETGCEYAAPYRAAIEAHLANPTGIHWSDILTIWGRIFNKYASSEDFRFVQAELERRRGQHTCARKACQVLCEAGWYAIWNEPSTGEPRIYCPKCGNRIIKANPSLRFDYHDA